MKNRAFARTLAAMILAGLVASSSAASGAAPGATDIALEYVKKNNHQLGLSGSDVNEIAISDTVASAHNGVTHVYLQQQHRGIDVFTGLINVNVARDGSVLSAGNRFVSNLAAAAGGQSAKKAAVEAVSAAADHLGLKPSKASEGVGREGRRGGEDVRLGRRHRRAARSRRSSCGSRPTALSGSPGASGSTRPTTGGTRSSTPRPVPRSVSST